MCIRDSYYPREGENLENAEVIAPELETLVNLQGESTSSRVHDIASVSYTHLADVDAELATWDAEMERLEAQS